MSGEVGGAGGAYSYNALKRLDKLWSSICSVETGGFCAAAAFDKDKSICNTFSTYRLCIYCAYIADKQEPEQVVSTVPGLFSKSNLAGIAVDTFDVIVCGGTLGIFLATALSCKGLKVGVVERNILKGVCFYYRLIMVQMT